MEIIGVIAWAWVVANSQKRYAVESVTGAPLVLANSAICGQGVINQGISGRVASTVFQVSAEARDLVNLARARKLKPGQYSGGTLCITNLGMMGIERFTAIINPPNAAILAIGTIVKKPVVKDDRIAIGQRMSLFLSCDHRVVDGATGARYLAALKELLEKPALLLV